MARFIGGEADNQNLIQLVAKIAASIWQNQGTSGEPFTALGSLPLAGGPTILGGTRTRRSFDLVTTLVGLRRPHTLSSHSIHYHCHSYALVTISLGWCVM